MQILSSLRRVLEERGLSQAELAAASGMSYAAVQRAVRDNANPFLDDALRMARVLELPVEQLFRLSPARERVG